MNVTGSTEQIARDIKGFVGESYPNIEIRVEPWDDDPARLAIYFTEDKFADLYPQQRYHYLTHLIPADYQAKHLENSVWFELAPGEQVSDLRYPDDDLLRDITPDVTRCLSASGFFRDLDDLLCPQSASVTPVPCWGDFRNSKPILLRRGFVEDEFFDIFHVLMGLGGFCDCEILYNAVETSRLKSAYWKARAEGDQPGNPHRKT